MPTRMVNGVDMFSADQAANAALQQATEEARRIAELARAGKVDQAAVDAANAKVAAAQRTYNRPSLGSIGTSPNSGDGPYQRYTSPPLQYSGGQQPVMSRYDETAAPADQPPGVQADPGKGLPVQMKDGTIRYFNSLDPKDPNALELDRILKAGEGTPLDIYGQPMKLTPNVYGGYLVTDSKGQAMPLNVAMGLGALPGQDEALSNYMSAGWKPGDQALASPPALPASASQYYPGGQGAGSPFDFGYLTQHFDEQFKGPQAPAPFQAPTGEQAAQDPGYQFMLGEAQKALERKGSAQLYSGTPRAGKEMARFTEDYAGTHYGDVYGRKFNENQSALNQYNSEWQKQMAEYAQKRDVFRGNRADTWNYIAPLADMGQVATAQVGNYGTNLGVTAGNNTIGAGNAQAAAGIAGANARTGAVSNILNNAVDLYAINRNRGLNSVGR